MAHPLNILVVQTLLVLNCCTGLWNTEEKFYIYLSLKYGLHSNYDIKK